MPVDITSRYKGLPIAHAPDDRGDIYPSIGQRLVTTLTPAPFSHRLAPLESLESLAAKQFNNSAYWWKIADANPRVFPLDWRTGDVVRLPGSAQVSMVQRSRTF